MKGSKRDLASHSTDSHHSFGLIRMERERCEGADAGTLLKWGRLRAILLNFGQSTTDIHLRESQITTPWTLQMLLNSSRFPNENSLSCGRRNSMVTNKPFLSPTIQLLKLLFPLVGYGSKC
ncbi:hypothetical protein V6N13_014278 [Hibiscus sabdariffa]